MFYIPPYPPTMWPLCTQASPAHLAGGWRGSAPELAPLSRCFSAPSQKDAVHFIFPSPPTLSLSLCECYYCPNNSAALALRSTGLSAGAEPLWRGNLPRSELSLFAGFTAPRVFSRGLPPPPLMTEKISTLHAGSLSYDKKQVLLNKPDVNNC